ncbi:MAG: efflux RND transporter permease subunit [Gammaproteobacteria bacterium]|nr:efflux RND transporter permease subunit [Gammaproteobacteria bacterium]
MYWQEFTLNNISLLALSLVAGVLVDDAIVEIENIVRHMRMGKNGYQAALDAADEIGLAVVATSATIIAVFLPVSFMGGFSGQYFKQFGLTVAAAVFFSLLVARLITPLIAAYTLKPHDEIRSADGPLMSAYPTPCAGRCSTVAPRLSAVRCFSCFRSACWSPSPNLCCRHRTSARRRSTSNCRRACVSSRRRKFRAGFASCSPSSQRCRTSSSPSAAAMCATLSSTSRWCRVINGRCRRRPGRSASRRSSQRSPMRASPSQATMARVACRSPCT